jgi:hypothetical protein
MSFERYESFIAKVLCEGFDRQQQTNVLTALRANPATRRIGLDPYLLLRVATEAFLLVNSGVWEHQRIDYSKLEDMLLERDTLDGKYGPFKDKNGDPITMTPDAGDKVGDTDAR